jgi:hypothetical protein
VLRVRHNGVERAIDVSTCSHLGEVIALCSRAEGGEFHVPTRVSVNGCVIPEQSLDKLETFPLEGVEEIQVETCPPREIAVASLESSWSYAGEVARALEDTAAHLRAGRIDDGNRLYAEAVDALGVLLYALSAAADTLGEAAGPIVGLGEELHPWLETLLEAQSQRDWLRVADYVEFEVAARVDAWRGMIRQTQSAAALGGTLDADA